MVKLITTSIIRGSEAEDSRGGAYVIDVENQQVHQAMNWNPTDDGRKGPARDVGLRGIAIDGETVYFVSHETLYAFSPDLEFIESWRNPYLKQASEMSIYERTLYIASAGCDSILAFELDKKKFFWALHVDLDRFKFTGTTYDPMGDDGPLQINKLHLNNVHTNDDGMYFSGLKSGGMLHFNGEAVYMSVTLPEGSHNAQPYRDGALFIDTEADAVRYASRSGEEDRAVQLPNPGPPGTERPGADDSGIDRQKFGRGLCLINERVVATGSSPATISIHDLQESKPLLSVNLSEDANTAIHALALWPF
jgi:hypothetical protein